MLESQKEFATYLRKMASLLNGQPFSYDQTLLEKVMETELVVPVVGAFSAGKSSLLNALMGKDILPRASLRKPSWRPSCAIPPNPICWQ